MVDYTVSNCMETVAYNQYIRLLKEGEDKSLSIQFLDEEDSNTLFSTIKNYRTETGVSRKIHEKDEEIYEIKGPMGKGLRI